MRRVMEIFTPLGDEVLLFHRMNAREELSRLSEFEVDLLSEQGDIDLDAILGKNVTIKLELQEDKVRHFNGYVTRFAQTGMHGRYHAYRATVRPWLWMLTRTADCRIFQDMTVPEIIAQVFADHTVADVKNELIDSYRKWVYCVQYRETDFNFVSRLMEQEGIYYFFKHVEGRHTLVLADGSSAHEAVEGYASLPFIPSERMVRPETEYISQWHYAREICPGKYAIDDYDFERPSVDLAVKSQVTRKHMLADYEIYDYPGEYVQAADGAQYADARIDELQTQFELAHADSNARGLAVGHLFKLTGQPRDDQNREYLVVATTYALVFNQYESADTAGSTCNCCLTALNSRQQFRPRRTTPKPTVQGPQTAVVVGPAGDEIHTDKYGRVKVQFHWDRYGKKDENSSCWIRPSHPWAGKNWGMVAIPRMGQEVIVDFLEGDPDQPIITGRVYNADVAPPFGLPAAGMISGIKSKTHKGRGYNEMSMDDTAGKEKIVIHGQHDMETTIEHDQTTTVKNNRTTTVNVDDALTVDAKRTMHVKGKLTETIDTGHEATVSAGKKLTVTGGFEETVTGERKTTVTGPIKQSASATIDIHATGAGTYTSETSLKLAVAGSVVEITPSAITISSNGSTIKIDATGVAVNGLKISLNG